MITAPDSIRFSKTLQSAILWPVSVIFCAAFLLLLIVFMLLRVVQSSEQSYEVIANARTCEELVLSAQNNLRGYLLSHDPAFPASFALERARIDAAFEKLKLLVQSDPQQVERVDDLISAKNDWLNHAQRRVDGTANPVMAERIRAGTQSMDNVRLKFRALDAREEALHQHRRQEALRTKEAVGLAGGGVVLLMALTVGYLVRRQFMQLARDYGMALDTIQNRHAELVRSEADLEKQKEWFRVTLTSIGDGVIVTDPEGRVVFMNHEAERLTAWNSVEALLKPLSSVLHIVDEETRVRERDPMERVFAEKKTVALGNHSILISRAGEDRPIEDSAAPISDASGKVLGVVVVFHDATDVRQSQKALKLHSEELEEKVLERTTILQQTVSELETFSYTISHDLRSPLRAMQGFAQAVLEDYGDKLDATGKGYLGRITKASERLDRLIQDLLSYTRLSHQDSALVPLDADEVLRDILENYPNLHPPAAEVEVEGTLPRVLGQEAALSQVFSNLLGNAAKFVPAHTTPHIRVWSEERDGHVRLWVQDNGIGISPENYDRIFQMFVQVDDAQLYGGTGVGLAIVKRAVETMHGSIGVESPEEGGSRFWVELARA